MRLAMGLEATKVITFTLNITPGALGAATITTQELAFTVPAGAFQSGEQLQTTDQVIVQPPSLATSICPVVYARVTTAGPAGTAVVTLGFANMTAAANTPVAGVYTFTVIRA